MKRKICFILCLAFVFLMIFICNANISVFASENNSSSIVDELSLIDKYETSVDDDFMVYKVYYKLAEE